MILNTSKLFGALAIMLLSLPTVESTEVTLRERVVSNSSVVRLGDVAEVAAKGPVEQQRLAGLLLMPAPAPGTQRFLRQREVQDMLAAQGEDLRRLRITGADQIAVVTLTAAEPSAPDAVENGTIDRQAVLLAGRIARPVEKQPEVAPLDNLASERIRGQLDKMIVEYLTSKAGRADSWRVTFDMADRYLTLLQTATSAPKLMGGSEPWTGQQRFVVSFTTAKGTVQMPLYADVSLATPVVVAIRPIERGQLITAAHVDVQTVDYMPNARAQRMPVESVDKIIGMEAQQPIKPGEIVYINQLRAPLLVKRGDEVAVVSQGRGIRVRTLARVLQDASLGELVQVETLDKRDRYDARVAGTRLVTVFTPSRATATRPRPERAETAWR